jgi:hypothetical protein
VPATITGNQTMLRVPTKQSGELRVELRQDGRRTWLDALVTPAPSALIAARVRVESLAQKTPAQKAPAFPCRRVVGTPPAVPVSSHPSNIAKSEQFQRGTIRLMTMGVIAKGSRS